MLAALSIAAFLCVNPSHHDGDNIYCAGQARSNRLYGIDAPEMPGACRPGRQCTPGDPDAARAYLQSLTAGRRVMCERMGTDVYGRTIVRCTADGADLSCAMVHDGYAVERYSNLDCSGAGPGTPTRSVRPIAAIPRTLESAREFLRAWRIAIYLLAINAATYLCFRIDWRRAQRWGRRLPENLLLLLAVLGGSPAALLARYQLRHRTTQQSSAIILTGIFGVQLGAAIGYVLL